MVDFVKRNLFVVPGKDCTVNPSDDTHIRMVDVSKITPVGVQNTFSTILDAVTAHPPNIFISSMILVYELVPAAYTRTIV